MANPNPSPATRIKKGEVRNPKGRPKGKTMKEFAREWLMSMTEEQKYEWIEKQSPETVWKMAEGNPHQTTDSRVVVDPIPLDPDVQKDNSVSEDQGAQEKD